MEEGKAEEDTDNYLANCLQKNFNGINCKPELFRQKERSGAIKEHKDKNLLQRVVEIKLKNDLKEDIKKHLQIEEKNMSDNGLDDFDIINESEYSDLMEKDLQEYENKEDFETEFQMIQHRPKFYTKAKNTIVDFDLPVMQQIHDDEDALKRMLDDYDSMKR